MKKFFGEFKKFITRGNVMDMAVGVIVGGAFTAIVNGLSNFILKPLINFALFKAFGANSLSDVYTFLNKVETTQDVLDESGAVIGTETVVDLANSIYIDWGSFINAVINFFLIAFVLFCIVRVFNRVRDNQKELVAKAKKNKISKEDRKALKADGVKLSDKKAVAAWFAAKAEKEAAEAAAAAAAAEEQARLDRLANPTSEDLLKDIRALLLRLAPEGETDTNQQ